MKRPEIVPSRKLAATVDGLFMAGGADFVTSPVSELPLTLEGIPGDIHRGVTRRSGGREPWYPRGTEIRNERQVTVLSRDDLAQTAAEMGIDRIEPEWIGGNVTLSGIPMLSMLPASTLLFFEGGATLKIDFQNGPCKISGASVARHVGRPDDAGLALAFVQAARRRRGLVAWVEKPGTIVMGEGVRVQLPEQWIYPV
ncbi:MOSC domain-containing protein [Oricola thermophila]|uniref:Molybdenum cofactor sulfurase n=1 Tax=Oricola thermophila TaxID=2742145 RepID=A0A6N1VBW2_9HYPH|nr:molybdenum cofactor sulfurase [Oricola thermophila]QKV18384.1 molybdenum cofactor sulfurase [Oricola thermophila]